MIGDSKFYFWKLNFWHFLCFFLYFLVSSFLFLVFKIRKQFSFVKDYNTELFPRHAESHGVRGISKFREFRNFIFKFTYGSTCAQNKKNISIKLTAPSAIWFDYPTFFYCSLTQFSVLYYIFSFPLCLQIDYLPWLSKFD